MRGSAGRIAGDQHQGCAPRDPTSAAARPAVRPAPVLVPPSDRRWACRCRPGRSRRAMPRSRPPALLLSDDQGRDHCGPPSVRPKPVAATESADARQSRSTGFAESTNTHRWRSGSRGPAQTSQRLAGARYSRPAADPACQPQSAGAAPGGPPIEDWLRSCDHERAGRGV
jgi:hypothetical protein